MLAAELDDRFERRLAAGQASIDTETQIPFVEIPKDVLQATQGPFSMWEVGRINYTAPEEVLKVAPTYSYARLRSPSHLAESCVRKKEK